MPRWKKARIVTQNQFVKYETRQLAMALVGAGLAEVISRRPLIVKLIPVERIGSAFIPADCKNFIEELIVVSGYRYDGTHRTRRPRLHS